jgi:hypothetical protein
VIALLVLVTTAIVTPFATHAALDALGKQLRLARYRRRYRRMLRPLAGAR